MNNRRFRSALWACVALTAIGASAAFAQSTTPSQPQAGNTESDGSSTTLKPIVVKGQRVANKASEDAGSVADSPTATETTAQTIDAKQINRIEDLGRSTDIGVGFDRTTGSVNIRGLQDNRVLTTVDGIEIPWLDGGARTSYPSTSGGSNSFDFNTLSTVDVVRGADSSRAGGGALGGALVLRTLEPEDLIQEGQTWGGVFKLDYNGDDTSTGGSAAIAKRIDNTAILFEGGYRRGHELENNGDRGGYSTTREDPNPLDYRQNNELFKVRQYTDSGHTFGFTVEHYGKDSDIDLKTLQTPTGSYRPGLYDGIDNTRRTRVSLDYKYEATGPDSLLDKANAAIYWQGIQRQGGTNGYRFTAPIGDYSRDNEQENKGIGFAGNAEKSFDTGNLRHDLTMGLNFVFTRDSSYSTGVDSCDVVFVSTCNFLHSNQADSPNVHGAKVGAFVDDKISLGSSGFSLTPGLRFDWYKYDPKLTSGYESNPNYAINGLPPGQSEARISPKLRASYEPQKDVEFYAQWAMGFRPPSADELYLNYGAPGTYLSIGNPDLKPETSNGFEIGTNLGDKDFGGHIGVFYNKYRNFIDTNFSPDLTGTYPFGITEYFNRAHVRMYGIEANAHKTFDNGIHVNGSFVYTNGKDSDTGEWIDSVAPAKVALGVGYATEQWGTDLTYIAATKEPFKADDNFRAPGYGIVDLTGWYEPKQLKGLTVRAGVYNVFNKTYYDALNTNGTITQPERYYSEPGRTFKISLVQRF